MTLVTITVDFCGFPLPWHVNILTLCVVLTLVLVELSSLHLTVNLPRLDFITGVAVTQDETDRLKEVLLRRDV